LIERGAIAESLIQGAPQLTNEQVKLLLLAALSTPAASEMLIGFHKANHAAQTTIV
jgi:hypothetical protein